MRGEQGNRERNAYCLFLVAGIVELQVKEIFVLQNKSCFRTSSEGIVCSHWAVFISTLKGCLRIIVLSGLMACDFRGGKRGSNDFHSHAAKSYLKSRTDSSIMKMIGKSEIHNTASHCSFATLLTHFEVAKAETGVGAAGTIRNAARIEPPPKMATPPIELCPRNLDSIPGFCSS